MSGRDDRGWLLIVVAAVALLVGVLVGRQTGAEDRATAADLPGSSATVSLGVVHQSIEGPVPGADFELPVHNSTQRPVDATIVGLGGFPSPLSSFTTRAIAPGAWTVVPFSVAPDCDLGRAGPVSSVRLRLGGQGGRREASLPLPDQGSALVAYVNALCATGPQTSPSKLAGDWIVEEVYGTNTYLAGTRLMRFGRDGSFAADSSGGLDSRQVEVRGDYRLKDGLLRIHVVGGYGCKAGANATWRATVDHDDHTLMSMVWIRGTCPVGASGDVWVARQILRPAGVARQP
jgi:hypothetical protein